MNVILPQINKSKSTESFISLILRKHSHKNINMVCIISWLCETYSQECIVHGSSWGHIICIDGEYNAMQSKKGSKYIVVWFSSPQNKRRKYWKSGFYRKDTCLQTHFDIDNEFLIDKKIINSLFIKSLLSLYYVRLICNFDSAINLIYENSNILWYDNHPIMVRCFNLLCF